MKALRFNDFLNEVKIGFKKLKKEISDKLTDFGYNEHIINLNNNEFEIVIPNCFSNKFDEKDFRDTIELILYKNNIDFKFDIIQKDLEWDSWKTKRCKTANQFIWTIKNLNEGKTYSEKDEEEFRTDWNEIATDVAKRFKKVTGHDLKELFDQNGEFIDDKVDETFPSIIRYVEKKYRIDISKNDQEDFLYILDDTLKKYYLLAFKNKIKRPVIESRVKKLDEWLNEIWKSHIQDVYTDFEEFEDYNKIYGLAKRLGFKSTKEAWDKNPMIQGSTDPKDYKIIKESKEVKNSISKELSKDNNKNN